MPRKLGNLIFLLVSGLLIEAKEDSNSSPPPFFLQDSQDGMCLAGTNFKRCGIDTLFYVVGSPGAYQIHKRKENPDDESEEELCLAKKTCDDVTITEELKLASCNHCGSQKWNILGDASTGYVLSENEGKSCVLREKGSLVAKTTPCDSKSDDAKSEPSYTPLSLQFASKEDLTLMQSPTARFIAASAEGDLETVKKYFDAHTADASKQDANARDWDELTALIPAASGGYQEVVQFLLDKGADVNAADKDGITPLMEAAIMGHDHIVKLLVQHGAVVENTSTSGITALWLAAGEGKNDVISFLLEKTADPNNARSDGITTLMNAAMNGHEQTVSILLEAGADIFATDNEDLNCLASASEKGNLAVLKTLVKHVEEKHGADKKSEFVNHISKTGFTALIVSSAHGHLDIVQFLVKDCGADIDYVQPETGVTALMYAAAGGYTPVVQFLIDNGADVHKLHHNDGSALMEAATAGKVDVMKALKEKGALVEILDKDGVTALMSASSQGHYDCVVFIVEVLKEKLSDKDFETYLNRLSNSGGSAVMFAAAAGKPDVAKFLIGHGANYDQTSHATPEYLEQLAEAIEKGTLPEDTDEHVEGVTSVHVAAQHGYIETLKVFLDVGAKIDILDVEERTPLLLAIKGNHGDCATALVKAGANPNMPYVDDEGEAHNLLMDAIIVENVDFALALIEKGAKLDYKDERGVTTLLQASHRGLLPIVNAILDSTKEYINIPSEDGITPLIASSSEGQLPVVERLLQESSIDINARDKDQTTSLMAASARGHVEIVQALIKAKAEVNLQNVDGHTALMFAYNGKTQVETLWERYTQFVSESTTTTAKNDGGTGPIIQEALTNHTKIVDSLKAAGADESLKDKEGHVAKDFDFHPDLDGDVVKQEEKVAQETDSSKNEL